MQCRESSAKNNADQFTKKGKSQGVNSTSRHRHQDQYPPISLQENNKEDPRELRFGNFIFRLLIAHWYVLAGKPETSKFPYNLAYNLFIQVIIIFIIMKTIIVKYCTPIPLPVKLFARNSAESIRNGAKFFYKLNRIGCCYFNFSPLSIASPPLYCLAFLGM